MNPDKHRADTPDLEGLADTLIWEADRWQTGYVATDIDRYGASMACECRRAAAALRECHEKQKPVIIPLGNGHSPDHILMNKPDTPDYEALADQCKALMKYDDSTVLAEAEAALREHHAQIAAKDRVIDDMQRDRLKLHDQVAGERDELATAARRLIYHDKAADERADRPSCSELEHLEDLLNEPQR